MAINTTQEGQAGEVGRHRSLWYSGVSCNNCEILIKANDNENRVWRVRDAISCGYCFRALVALLGSGSVI